MKILSRILPVFFLLVSVSSFANDDWRKTIEPHIALRAVEVFRADPVAEDAEGYLSVIVNFAEYSEDVLASVDMDYFPEEYEVLEGRSRTILLGAYIAGNIEKQIRLGVKQDSPDEGVDLMLLSYRALQQSGEIEKLSSFEEWIRLNSAGRLRVTPPKAINVPNSI